MLIPYNVGLTMELTLGVSLVVLGPMGATRAVDVHYGQSRLRWGRKERITALYKDIFTARLHTSIKRQTKQNVATLGVSLVVLRPPWKPLWPWMWDMPTLDWDEVGKSKKLLNIRISFWEVCILASKERHGKTHQSWAYHWLFWGRHGGPYGCGCATCPSLTKMR